MPYQIPVQKKRTQFKKINKIIITKQHIKKLTDKKSEDENYKCVTPLPIKSYVITIRPIRYNKFLTRMGPWGSSVEKVNGVNGHSINIRSLIENKHLDPPRFGMKRGRIGCFLSHRNVWQKIVDNDIPIALILEDDVNLIYCKHHCERLKNVIAELTEFSGQTDNWDLAYLCYRPRGIVKRGTKISSNFSQTTLWQVLYGYIVTQKCAMTLLKHSLPIRTPVDVYIGDMAKKMKIKCVRLNEPICGFKYIGSDTESII